MSRFIALRSSAFKRWFVGHSISQSGFFAQAVGLGIVALRVTDSPVAISMVAAVQYLPIVLAGPYAGVVGDRFDRRRLLMVTQLSAILEALTLAALVAFGEATFWRVFAVGCAIGITFSFDQPVRRTLVADLVTDDVVVSAVSLAGAVGAVAKVAGSALGGLLTATVGVAWCFVVNAASSAVMIVALAHISDATIRRPKAAPERTWKMVADARRSIAASPSARSSFLVLAALSLFGYNWDLSLLLLSNRSLGAGGGVYAMLSSLFGVGALAGTIVMAARPAPELADIARWSVWYGIAAMAVGGAPSVVIGGVMCIITGYLLIPVFIGITALLQVSTRPDMRARVMSFFSIVFIGGQAVGAIGFGWSTDLVGVRTTIAAGGAVVASVGGAIWGNTVLQHDQRRNVKEST